MQRDVQLRLYAKDLERVEQLVAQGHADEGHAILLTNFDLMWQSASHPSNQFADFVLTQGRALPAQMKWAGDPLSKHTANLIKSFVVNWEFFSAPEGTEFRYLDFET